MISLIGQRILITGASEGIGREIAKLVADLGASVIACGRNIQRLEELRHYSSNISIECFDVNEQLAIKEVFIRLKKAGGLTGLVNNAGVMSQAPLQLVNRETFEDNFSTNVYSIVSMSQFASRLMSKKGGSIVNMSSILATNAVKGQLIYSATKAAVESITKTMALELATYNVRVNAVAPGAVDTQLYAQLSEEIKEKTESEIPLGKLISPKDVAQACAYLLSNESRFVTGEVLKIDGGWSL
ncbi:SDR family oxidoreductase [Psychrobium sp. MM17-31]|uniref:SDR family NAD(P)-dependent oxidoreductase n=1 Tax=Psychrobium sp. MM17-31 TaxID=2917758 RepID=UPI001EF6DC2B|nr:SDR family NAD(P)-dependent oxidoreductase [Psychrobium sp. MM17-31]MCG7530111.1 SDR family oxidoreductase [Psychrobium sp. MM17-31]